jgi:hypothetical protein
MGTVRVHPHDSPLNENPVLSLDAIGREAYLAQPPCTRGLVFVLCKNTPFAVLCPRCFATYIDLTILGL